MTASEQARADAMADAETLRRYLWQHYKRRYRRLFLEMDFFAAAILHLRPDVGPTLGVTVSPGCVTAWRNLASDLFRAVPGLR